MARFSVCVVTLVVLLATGAAVSATTIRMEIRGESRRCGEQIESHDERLSSCREYLRENEGWREEFPRCCEELEQINEQCRCKAVKQVAQQECGLQGREKREMLRTAQSLTSLCRISPQSCPVLSVSDASTF